MDGIAERAGVALGTLYYSVAGKAALLLAAVSDGLRALTGRINPVAGECAPIRRRLRGILEAQVEMLVEYPKIASILFRDIGVGKEAPSGIDPEVEAAVAFAALTVFTWVKERNLQALSLRVVYDLRDRLFERIQRLRYEFFDQHQSGEIISIVTNGVNRFQDSVDGGLSFLLSRSISLVAIVAILLTIDLTLTLIVLAMVPVFVLIIRTVSGRVRRLSRKVQDLLAEVASVTGEVVRGVDVIKSYVLERRAADDFRNRNREMNAVAARQVNWRAGSATVSTLVGDAIATRRRESLYFEPNDAGLVVLLTTTVGL